MEQIGAVLGWSSPVLTIIGSPIKITESELSWIATITTFVAAFCSPLPFITLLMFGRKVSIAINALPFLISWIMIACATTATELIVARGIVGISMAYTYTVIPIYLGEIATDEIRGGIGLCMNVLTNVGIMFIYGVGTLPDLWLSSLISALPLVLIIVFYIWLPESPYYLLGKGKREEALKELKKLRNSDCVEDEFKKMEEIHQTEQNCDYGFSKLFQQSSNRKALAIVLGVNSCLHFSGAMTLVYFAHTIFEKAGNADADNMALIKATLQLVTSIGAAYVVDRLGKRPLLIASSIGAAVFMFVEAIYFHLLDAGHNVDGIWWIPLVGMILFNVSQSIGLAAVPLAYLGELFHPDVKNLAVCICKTYDALAVFLVGQLTLFLWDNYGSSIPFFFFGSMSVVGLVFIIFFAPETKGKSLTDIQYYLIHNKYREEPIGYALS